MNTLNRTARIAGALYLFTILTGAYSLLYVPSKLEVHGDIAATVANILASEATFRSAIAVGLISFAVWIALPLVLYKLLSATNKEAAILMVILAVIFVPIDFAAFAKKLDVLSLLSRPDVAQVYATNQLNAQVRWAFDEYGNLMLASELFWGLWLLPFGYLVFKSQLFPRIFGIVLMIGCVSYLIEFARQILFPHVALPAFIMWPAAFGEFGICLWMLVVGARETKIGSH